MVFVTKEHGDYQTVHINHISSTHLERLAAYFEQLKMKVYKGSASLDWEEVLEYVVNEPEGIRLLLKHLTTRH
jgi:nucleosome binding factor SPN SPT16 subunit